MTNPDLVPLHLEISAQNGTAEDIDWVTRQLFSELRVLDIECTKQTKGGTVKFKGMGFEFEGPPECLHKLPETPSKEKQ